MPADYPKKPEAVKRPYRLWDATACKQLPHRAYSYPRNAHLAALIEARWMDVGRTIEVFEITTGKLLGQYTRRLHTIAFM